MIIRATNTSGTAVSSGIAANAVKWIVPATLLMVDINNSGRITGLAVTIAHANPLGSNVNQSQTVTQYDSSAAAGNVARVLIEAWLDPMAAQRGAAPDYTNI